MFSRKKAIIESGPQAIAKARRKAMDLLARRDHSTKELKKKLSLRFEPPVVDQVLAEFIESKWLPSGEDEERAQAGRFARVLGRKLKSQRLINQKLKQLGLPVLKSDFEEELEKASRLVKRSLSSARIYRAPSAREIQIKLRAMLVQRGFATDVVRAAIQANSSMIEKNLRERNNP